MIPEFAVLSGLVLSASCMVLHQPRFPILDEIYYDPSPNYNFAYEVNNAHTGDIKSQQETRHGSVVLGQYSLLQPDGVQRTVEYRADDHTGFQATVNNQEPAANVIANNVTDMQPALPNSNDLRSTPVYPTYSTAATPQIIPKPVPTPTAPVVMSSSSFTLSIPNDIVPSLENIPEHWQ